MLIRVNDVIGSKIVSYLDDTVIDTVKDVVYEPSENKITALIVREKKLFQDSFVLPFDSIGTIEDGKVYIHAAADIKRIDHAPEPVSYIANNNFYLTNSKILTDSGKNLGYITDMLFHPDTGIVEEFEVTERTRLLNKTVGKKRIAMSDIITVGRQSTIVREHKNKRPDQSEISHVFDQGPMQSEHDTNLQHVPPSTLQQPQDISKDQAESDNSEQQLDVFEERLRREPAFTKKELQEYKTYMYMSKREEVVGMYLTKNILLENDNFFAQSGELVTHKMVEDAEHLGLLEQVLKHASPLPPAISYQIRQLITQAL